MLSISEVEHIDLTAAAADGSQIADLLSSYDKANAETQTAAIKVEHEAEAASSKEEEEEEEEEEDKSTPTGGQGGYILPIVESRESKTRSKIQRGILPPFRISKD